ncbi:MAG: hypothetical protein JNL83_08655 [Myxococcales bacterium]|nr:hypothetical protein [Myxococcales bacterium]
MANGVPVRLSEALTTRARSVAAVQDRSLTEQVEHWARLGQVVEQAISAGTMMKLKARSYDEGLADALAFADTSEGRAAALELIQNDNEVRHEETAAGLFAVSRDGKRTKVTKPALVAAIDPEARIGHAAAATPIRSAEAAKGRRGSAKLHAVADARVTVKIPRKRPKAR